MQRIEEYNQLLEDSKEVLRKDTTLWKGFLKFATQFTHYQFFDQILIYVQNPKATACATFDQWKKIGRYVRKGEHSIVLLDETGKRGKLRHIFDVTATGPDQEFEYRPKPILPEQREELASKLNAAYSRENSEYAADSARWDGDLEHTLSQIALSMTQEYYNLSPDQAAAQSESTEIPAYYIATATSAMYLLLEKYGFSQEAESLDFSCMNQLDMETFSGVGNAASAILSWTARLVRTVQREQVRERGNEHERNDNGRYSETDHISSGGRFPGSEHRTPGERRESAGVTEVRDDAEKLSEGEQPSGIRESGSEWNTVSGDGEGGRSSGSDQGTGITATAQGRGSDRGTETERSAQMGGTDGILPPSGGGNYSDGTGVQLTLSDYFEIRPTDRENVSVSDRRQQNAVLPADPSVRNFSYTLVDGEVYYRENSTMRKIDRSDAARDRTKGLLKIRDALNQVIQLQVEDATDEEIQRAQRKLGIEYNLFSKRYGLINSRQNALMMDGDSSYFLLCSLENLDKDGNLRSKADIFTKRTIRAQQEITFVETPADALAVSIGEKGHVDLPYMADLLGKGGEAEQEQITRELSGVIFRDPQEKEEQRAWKTADEYLSGNVRDKLRMAQLAAQRDVRYEENVRALQEAQPKNLTASEIDVRLGATWIDAEYIEAFMYETFHTPYYQRQRIKLTFAAVTGEWQISGKTFALENDVSVYNRYGTARMGAYAILEQTLNLRTVTVYDRVTDAEGTTRSVVNPRETMLAQQKQAAIKEAFAGWIWKDPQRRQRLEQVYNERFNNLRPAEFSGEHIRFHGMNPAIQLRTHQKNAIAHILYGGNTLLAHEVGAGKTYTMVAAAMESKRLGLCQKSLFVVPNHLTLQWANDFLKLYPAANLLVASKKDFETANRKKFCARIATGDYDAIIIGHSQFERIPVSIERQERLLQKQLDEIENALRESMNERDQSFTVKQMEKTRKSLKIRLEKLQAQERKDDIVTFEQLGVDRLFVDEAHAYKNLFLYTKMRNIAGLSTSEAQKSTDMYMKCRYMDELTGGKGIIFATGTPISNSMTELYTMMRYLQYDALQERGLTQFDAWASTFGETVTASELAPEGTGYRQKTRFAKFFNLPELMNLFKQTADIKTKDQLNLPVPEVETKTIVAQPSELQKKMVAELSERAAAVHNGAVDPTIDNMLKITSDGRKIGLDQRLMNPLLSDDTASKVNLCVGNVLRIWEEGKEKRLTQLIFCDNSVPKPNTFNIYDDVKGKLIAAGIPEMEIAYIHDADTEIKKKNLFSKVNDGQVRILLGSTQKMGAGTNVQERLIAIHHLDVGWRPADMIQRNGRIIRQGNRNPVVQVYNYVTEGTFDSYLWQTLENKQKFISQIMTSKSPVRSCEDVDEQVLTYAEVKALCAGDDRIKEKMDLEVDIARLRMLKAEHQSMQYRLEDQLLKTFPEQIREKEGIIQKLDADIKTTEQYPPFAENTIFLEILGKVYTDQKEAAKAFLEAGKTCKDTRSIRIGSYRGFELEGYVNVITAEIQIAVKGKLSHPFELSDVPALNLKRLDSALNKLPERMILEKGKLEALYQQREDAQKQLNTPFPQEDELREKTKRLEELAVELDVDAGREPQENEDNEKTTMKISKPTGIRQSRFSRFRRQKDEKEEDADEDIDF